MALRVVAGSAGGRHLQVPKGVELRPTQDRIKQAMFSSLGERTPYARVLDLYAGTGALGIEALSRGANEAVFVEKSRPGCRCIAENLKSCGLTGIVIEKDVLAYLRTPIATPPLFDLIFADPPYDKTFGDASTHPLPAAIRPWIAPQGAFIWEFFSGQKLETVPGWSLTFHRRYGETTVAILLPA